LASNGHPDPRSDHATILAIDGSSGYQANDKGKGPSMRRRLALFGALLFIIFGTVGIGLANTLPAHASPAVEIGTNQDGSSQCMNRQGGGHVENFTYVIGWSCGDNNNDFELQFTFYEPCDSQTVTTTCPFSNHTFDEELDGAPIVQVEEYDYGYCIGTANGSSFTDKLESCADSEGLNGGWNGIMVAPGQSNGSNNPDCLINVHATNTYGGTTNIYGQLSNGHGNNITVSTGTNNPDCSVAAQWKELYN
jgi:hypothetical protein